jgi:hypothetical protein
MSEDQGNWGEIGFNNPAPQDDVAKYLGEENRENPVSVGVLKMVASLADEQWNIDSIFSSINRDSLRAGGMDPDTIPDLVAVDRQVPFSEENRLSTGIYDSGL